MHIHLGNFDWPLPQVKKPSENKNHWNIFFGYYTQGTTIGQIRPTCFLLHTRSLVRYTFRTVDSSLQLMPDIYDEWWQISERPKMFNSNKKTWYFHFSMPSHQCSLSYMSIHATDIENFFFMIFILRLKWNKFANRLLERCFNTGINPRRGKCLFGTSKRRSVGQLI